jgi:hypothetical protein
MGLWPATGIALSFYKQSRNFSYVLWFILNLQITSDVVEPNLGRVTVCDDLWQDIRERKVQV